MIKSCLKKYDDELEKYIPVLMAQARIYWDREHYPMVEKLFFQSSEFCSEHEVRKLINVAVSPLNNLLWCVHFAIRCGNLMLLMFSSCKKQNSRMPLGI